MVYFPGWMFEKIRDMGAEDRVLNAAHKGSYRSLLLVLGSLGLDYTALEMPEFGVNFEATHRRRSVAARVRRILL